MSAKLTSVRASSTRFLLEVWILSFLLASLILGVGGATGRLPWLFSWHLTPGPAVTILFVVLSIWAGCKHLLQKLCFVYLLFGSAMLLDVFHVACVFENFLGIALCLVGQAIVYSVRGQCIWLALLSSFAGMYIQAVHVFNAFSFIQHMSFFMGGEIA